MKKLKCTPIIAIAALLFTVLAAIWGIAANTKTAHAEMFYDGDYRFHLEEYYVTYDIADDCSIEVTEILNVHYDGWDSTGFYRDIPVNGGALVKNINVKGLELIRGGEYVPYEVIIEDNGFITVDIGDTHNKHDKNEVYCLTYTYCISNSVVKSGLLPLNPIGTGWECEINYAEVTLILPDGYLSAKRYVGKSGSTSYDTNFEVSTDSSGKTVISSYESGLSAYNGISFDLNFKVGAIAPYFDFTPYWFVLAGIALIIIIAVLKLLSFNKYPLTPVVNFDAPEEMDPLLMGKLIDNKVNSEDVTALIFYWADKGYVKINLDNKDDPVIIKISNLPVDSPKYEQIVYSGLFARGDAVKPSDLQYRFYKTFERASAAVNEQSKGLYMSSSIGVSIIFAILCGLITGIAPFVMGIVAVSSSLTYIYSFLALVPALVLYGFTETVAYNKFKNRGIKNAMFLGLIVLIILVYAGLYTLIIPGSLIAALPKFLISLVGFGGVCASVVIISRSQEYTKKLNDIVGFRNFILYAEKDRLEKMIDDDPQFYYHILPYAQVLNVSDKWEEKFRSITMPPPRWVTSSTFDTIIEFTIINSLIRNSMSRITSGMTSRPSSSGSNGFGGSFGGHSGGGFGGGGGRGR